MSWCTRGCRPSPASWRSITRMSFCSRRSPYIRSIFEKTAWWKKYHNLLENHPEEQAPKRQDFCLMLSKPPLENVARRKFADSPTGRGYLEADINPDPATAMMKPIHLATTQLERPVPPASMNCLERQAQAKFAIKSLGMSENVVFGGDMSWDDSTDGPFPRAAGWLDAWTQLKPHGSGDWTYDAFWNEKIPAFNGHVAHPDDMRKRSDRFVCKLKDYKLSSIELIGGSYLRPQIRTYTKYLRQNDYRFSYEIHLKPSCHRGLVLTLVPA